MLSIYNRVRISLEVEDLEETKRETRLNNKCCYKERILFPPTANAFVGYFEVFLMASFLSPCSFLFYFPFSLL